MMWETPTCLVPSPLQAAVIFEKCQDSEAIRFESGIPGSSLREQGQLTGTGQTKPDTPIWDTIVKLDLEGHTSPPITQVVAVDVVYQCWSEWG
ncbi:hypothetical protein AAFF_G00083740 [Aldrovandia affinis]|uniref:Uncharacterized protein n=1 Tax=Aldrovandia affinis TaxID=143900 RepID=A0AAD7WCQ6_9TELE|nr:hypothetical protein AAFF_G00083740 [Aldrovandia affinis]